MGGGENESDSKSLLLHADDSHENNGPESEETVKKEEERKEEARKETINLTSSSSSIKSKLRESGKLRMSRNYSSGSLAEDEDGDGEMYARRRPAIELDREALSQRREIFLTEPVSPNQISFMHRQWRKFDEKYDSSKVLFVIVAVCESCCDNVHADISLSYS